MKDHQIRAWLKVVEVGSLRGAARALHLTQAAVTKAIKELEDELDAPLLVRSSLGISLTEFGHRITPRLRLSQAQLSLAKQDVRQLRGGEHVRVGAAVTPMAFLTVLPQVAQAFQQAFPLASLRLVEGLMTVVVPLLRQGEVDFAIAATSKGLIPTDLMFEPWAELEMMIACRRGHPMKDATEWSSLVDCEWLVHSASGLQSSHFYRWLDSAGLATPSKCTTTDTFGVTWSLLAHTDSLLLCPKAMLETPPYSEQVERIPLGIQMPSLELGIITLREVPLSFAAADLARRFEHSLAKRYA